MKNLVKFPVLLLCLLILSSCNEDIGGSQEATVNLVFADETSSRSVTPNKSLNVYYYSLTIENTADKITISVPNISGSKSSYTAANMKTGTWTFTIDAYNSSSFRIGTGSVTQEIVSGTNYVSLAVAELDGSGTLNVQVTVSSDIKDALYATVYDYKLENVIIEKTALVTSEGSSVYSAAFPLSAGYYTLLIHDGEEQIDSTAARVIEGDSITYTCNYDYVAPLSVSIDNGDKTAYPGVIYKAEAVPSREGDYKYVWYLDEEVIAGATDSSLEYSIPLDLSEEIHTLKVQATSSDGSESCTISKDINVECLYEFELKETDTESYYKITGVKDKTITSVIIPETYNGIKITTLGNESFLGCSLLESVYMPYITTIAGGGYNDTLKKVLGAFYQCTSLTYVEMPNVVSIGNSAFRECGFKSITIPEGVTTIGSNAFNTNKSLKSLNTANVTKIEHAAFEYCALVSVELPEVTEIEWEGFKFCYNLKSFYAPKVTSIGSYAFDSCTQLVTVDMPALIGMQIYAFQDCYNLTEVKLPSLKGIANGAFEGCRSLKTLDLPEVTSVGEYAFSGCTVLEEINLPKLTWVREASFKGCKAITTISFPKVEEIEDSAFENCTGLTSINVSNATSIGNDAFSGCTGLTSVDIRNATTLGTSVFANCTALKSVTVSSKLTEIPAAFFAYCTSLISFTIPTTVTSIGYMAFYSCTSIKSLTIPSNVTEIEFEAFGKCTSLTSMTLPSKLTEISYKLFNGCTSLTTMTIPAKVTKIGHEAFMDCKVLASITIPAGVTEIEYSAFKNCYKLTKITFKNTRSKWNSITFGQNCFSSGATSCYVTTSENSSYRLNKSTGKI